jgi:hypothetical protein
MNYILDWASYIFLYTTDDMCVVYLLIIYRWFVFDGPEGSTFEIISASVNF